MCALITVAMVMPLRDCGHNEIIFIAMPVYYISLSSHP
jgi:hypothetical protein